MSNWTEDKAGYMEDGGDIGGDYQISAAPQRRFVKTLDDGTFGLITVSAYVTGSEGETTDEDTVTEFDVCEQVEYMHCTDLDDPGSSELYTDYTYEYPFAFAPDDGEQGLTWAQNHVKSFTPEDFNWDGITAILH